jgi:hypothetical protein
VTESPSDRCRKEKERYYQYKELVFATCLLFDTVLLQVLASQTTLDKYMIVSAAILAISLPTLSCALFAMLQRRVITKDLNFLGTIGLFTTIVATSFIFFHFSLLIGSIFLFTLFLSVLLSLSYLVTLKYIDPDESI